MLDLIVERVRHVRRVIPRPFLLEQRHVDQPEQDMAEPVFLNRLSYESGCGIALDLHNVVSARNRFARGVPADLDLSRVVELHIAGGDGLLGFYRRARAGGHARLGSARRDAPGGAVIAP
jgi:uncharacterized protein (UPF0276 family)